MIRRLIIGLTVLGLLTIQAAFASQGQLQVRGYYGTNSIYSGSKNKVNVQLSTRAYYAIKNTGIENVEIKLNNSKQDENVKIDTVTTNAHLRGRNLVFSLPNNLLKNRGVHHLTVTTSNQEFDGSFNYIPIFEIVNNTNGGLEVEILSNEEPVQTTSSGDGLEIVLE